MLFFNFFLWIVNVKLNTFENEMYVCLVEIFFYVENVDILWYMCSVDYNYVVFRKDRRLMK